MVEWLISAWRMRSQNGDEPLEPPRKSSAVLPASLIEGLAEEQKVRVRASARAGAGLGLGA